MLKHFTAALAALFFLFPLSAVGESLDLSQLGAIEDDDDYNRRFAEIFGVDITTS